MPETFEVEFPEIFIGIIGPIGVDIEAITESLTTYLDDVGYDCHPIKITEKMFSIKADVRKNRENDFFSETMYKIDYANQLCKDYGPSILASVAIRAIKQKRKSLLTGKSAEVSLRTAYIIRQLKRPQEVELLRKIYGRQFVLVSAYGSETDRKRLIEEKLFRSLPTVSKRSEVSAKADRLIERDASENLEYGQNVREAFHLGDVFIDGISKPVMNDKVERFIQAFFGKTDISPSKFEYGMYAAKSASLRSSDLSRQVGAAIFSDNGELIAQGCNEGPKAFGGTYWDLETPDFRDVKLGHDPNELFKKEILRDVLERLLKAQMLSDRAKKLGNPIAMVDKLIRKKKGTVSAGCLSEASIMDLTEFGRAVHAEMCAICDAARLGRSVRGAILFCTTFPCHNCTKHLIASGIKTVVYMEPYPKSKTKDLFPNEVAIEEQVEGKVSFLPFLGISPFRYRDIFQKGRRKGWDGKAKKWYSDIAKPMVSAVGVPYLELEELAISELIALS